MAMPSIAPSLTAQGFVGAVIAQAPLASSSSGSKYEARERRLDVAEFLTIARKLGADPDKLLKGAE
jgi:hypothetical protein